MGKSFTAVTHAPLLKRSFFAMLFPFLLLPLAASAGSDLHMLTNGSIVASDILVYQKAGTNLFCRAVWGEAFFRFVVTTNASTAITKGHGEKATVGDIKEGDIINLTGSLVSGADSMTLIASSIQDSDLQTADKMISGAITNIDYGAQSFTLADKTLGKVTVSAYGLNITKGARTISVGELQTGDKVLSASGVYDYSASTLTASAASVYQDTSVFKPRNFQGTLKSLSGTSLPVSLVVTVGGTDYTVYLAKTGLVLNNAKKSSTLTRFVVGDIVRFYGAIRPSNLTEIDAEIVRDLNF